MDESAIPQKTLEALQPYRDGEGRIYNIWATLAAHPDALRRFLVFSNHVLGKNSLPVQSRELVILKVALHARAEYEWSQHRRIARSVGVPDEAVDTVIGTAPIHELSRFDQVLLAATDELLNNVGITDSTWMAVQSSLSTEQIIDLLYTVGQYLTIAMILNALAVVPEGEFEPLPAPSVPSITS